MEASVEISLTDREANLMDVLWEHGPSTVAEVRERLTDELAYNTVLTILRNLEAKGYVAHMEEGRAHRYLAAVTLDRAQHSAVKALTRKLFKGSTELLLTRLVSEKKLSAKELDRISAMLEARKRERGQG
jgi:BlaI family penicillinase repressor